MRAALCSSAETALGRVVDAHDRCWPAQRQKHILELVETVYTDDPVVMELPAFTDDILPCISIPGQKQIEKRTVGQRRANK